MTDGRDPDHNEPQAVYLSRNPSVSKGEVWLRGCRVPYIELFKVPVDDTGEQVYPISDNDDNTTTVHPYTGAYRWTLSVDNRWEYDFDTEREAVRAASMMADAMAVAVGWTCHGSQNRLNLHGPVIEVSTADRTPTVTLTTEELRRQLALAKPV